MVKKWLVPMNGQDRLELTNTEMSKLDAIQLWVPVLYHHAPWWLWDAIMGKEGETVNRLREEMTRYQDEGQ